MALPVFRYHPDPLRTGSVAESETTCRCCGQARGYIYTGPVYAEDDLDDQLCPWCIADGSAHQEFDATFTDSEAFSDDTPETAVEEITERTPGFNSFQTQVWPSCCGDAAAFTGPAGIAELRKEPEIEGMVLRYIIYDMEISGGAATRLLESLHRDNGPTVYLFQCLHCNQPLCHIDYL